jgi:hypothetical protein
MYVFGNVPFFQDRKEDPMERPVKLNHASPIVQRVLRLREHMAQAHTPLHERHSGAAERIQTRKNAQWQMWQKSDFAAYLEDEPEYRCKD